MKISRRDVLIGGAASLAAVVGVCPGPTVAGDCHRRHLPAVGSQCHGRRRRPARAGDGHQRHQHAIDLDLPLAKNAGLAGFRDAKVTVVYADHQGDPQKGRAEAERLITQRNVAALIGVYHSSVAVTVSQTAERYAIPFLSADNSSPSLHRRGLKFFFRPAAHDEMFSQT